jgi:hypothetical protein
VFHRRNLRNPAWVFLVFGWILLSLNIYGEVAPSTHPKAQYFIASETDRTFRPAQYALQDLEKLVYDARDLSFDGKMKVITNIFASAIVHYWPDLADNAAQDPELQLRFYQNYVLYISDTLTSIRRRYIKGEGNYSVKYYEYYDYKSAINRGVGLCSQASKAVADYLRREQGLTAGLLFLDGHVVAYALRPDDGSIVMLDADYDVYLPFSLEFAQQDADVLRATYERAGLSEETSRRIAGFYADTNNLVGAPVRLYNDESKKLRNAELARWTLPLLLLTTGLVLRRWRHAEALATTPRSGNRQSIRVCS